MRLRGSWIPTVYIFTFASRSRRQRMAMSARAKALAAWRDAVLSHDVFATFVTPGVCPLASLAGGVLEQCVDVGSEGE